MFRTQKIFTIIVISLFFLFISSFLAACKGDETTKETAGYMDVTPEEAKELIENNPDLIIIDVSRAGGGQPPAARGR